MTLKPNSNQLLITDAKITQFDICTVLRVIITCPPKVKLLPSLCVNQGGSPDFPPQTVHSYSQRYNNNKKAWEHAEDEHTTLMKRMVQTQRTFTYFEGL